PLFAYLLDKRGEITGIAFIDFPSIDVCHNKRIKRNKVFKGLAKKGKTTSGWFFGFKLHLMVNERGEILAFQLTPGNVADVSIAETLSKGVFGKLFGDKGYISKKLSKRLLKQGLELFTNLRSNRKQNLMKLTDKILLRKRSIIETVNDQLKHISQIEQTRHRYAGNFLINLLAGIVAYTHQPKKPSINLAEQHRLLLMAA
ncbi:IS982 family transposase, partial [Candidatus Protochlamydia sp. W-9]|uniref:IS982 family transposase n=1 Tax=Candidatus Protochlamydia sp. W-9 TaxID=1785087 RepID=UPI00096A9601